MTELAELKTQRASTKGCITRIKNLVDQKADTLTPPEIECRLGILESYFKQLLSYQTSIEKLVPEDATEAKIRGELEELYCAAKSKLLSLTASHRGSLCNQSESISLTSAVGNQLPKLRLPQFSGKYSDFSNFWGCFNKLVHLDASLSNLEKFNHLLTCLSGPALRSIKAFDITEDNYAKAVDHLKERYNNKYLIFQEHIVELFNLPNVPKNSANQLRNVLDNTSAHLNALLSLGSYENITNAFLIYLVNSKLDPDSQSTWEAGVDFSELPSWTKCSNILTRRCQYLESRDLKLHESMKTGTSRHANKAKPTKEFKGHTIALTTKGNCELCREGDHLIYKCPTFLSLSVSDRFKEVKKRSLCLNCLFRGHSVKKCSVQRCRVCLMPHHTLLHRYQTNNSINLSSQDVARSLEMATKQSNRGDRTQATNVGNTSLQTLCTDDKDKDHVFLATALVRIKDKFGTFHLARALLDSASQLNFVTERLVQLLRLSKDKVETNISGIGDTPSKVRYSTQTSIQSSGNDFAMNLQMFVLPTITGLQPERKISVENWKLPENIRLADAKFYEPQKVDLLIGAAHFFQLLCVGQIKLGEGLPTLQKTVLGWIVAGKYSKSNLANNDYSYSLLCDKSEILENEDYQDRSLTEIVEKFWEEENIESSPKYTEEQEQCESLFKNTASQQPNGRFIVKLPVKGDGQERLGNSLDIAKRRFLYLERKLRKNTEIKVQYAQFLKEYLDAGHMELVSIHDIPPLHYFCPHQYVLRPDSSSTKLRVVFDASSRTTSGVSLNDILMVGPVIQDDIFTIILRFRCYRFALTADISAMYRQVLVYPEDRNFQLIIWRDNPVDDFSIYRLKTVTYGTASAPFLATRCLVKLAEDVSANPKISRIISRDFYMDDLITGADTREELLNIREEVASILKAAQFNLRKLYSNDGEFLDRIPEGDREKTLRINDSDIIKTLGIIWEPGADKFLYNYKKSAVKSSRITKRTVLSEIAQLFDPLGLVNPVVSKAKIFLQELWILKLNWDESIPMELEHRWRAFTEELTKLQQIEVPRLVLLTDSCTSIELHGFCDASIRAYGCCIYVRCVDSRGIISVNLLAGKSKVAPIRTTRTLPCLELCGALLLAKLLDKVRKSFLKPLDHIYLWTDSEIVLDWLSCHPTTWKTFVANRVSEIQNRTISANWRHVNSKSNPADIISRGASASELLQSIWFSGPSYLRESPEYWPPAKQRHIQNNAPEKRKIKSVLLCSISEDFLGIVYGCSSFIKNCRRFALVLRFRNNCLLKKKEMNISTSRLSASEIDEAFIRIVWCIQQKEFAEDIYELERGRELSSKSNLKCLNAFLDESRDYKLLRVGGRLRHSQRPYDCKYPIMLPRNNPFVKAYVHSLHISNFHAGPLVLVSIIRQRFWIINAREYARKCVRQCIHCFKYRPQLMQQIMGDLPKGRANFDLPFVHVGVDFCGPFQTTHRLRGRASYKSYVAVFICFATRAVHIEVVSDLSADAFIAALKRFISRRNLCKHIYCDNATNFVGARRRLQEFRSAFFEQCSQRKIGDWCANKGIEFHHIPPRSPHFGGIWEAAVKSAKTLLHKTFQGSLLTFEELTTVMAQIEAILNSRPITPLSSDPSDEQALTPAHFLLQAPIEFIAEPDLSNEKTGYLRRWQRISALFQHFWQRWFKDYLCHLQERTRWKTAHPNAVIGSLVLIHDEDVPPFKWRLGRVVDANTGADNRIRVVSIKTGNKVIQRSIHKTAPLPLDEN